MESAGLLLAALVVILILAVYLVASARSAGPGGAFVASARSASPGGAAEPFLGTFYYAPSCGAEWGGRRRADCRGITTGVMPSIELSGIEACGLGCGRLGGIPP